jgi:hypothetical protein
MIPIGLIESAGSTLYSLGADRAGDAGGLTLNADQQRHVAAKTELISNLFIGPKALPRFRRLPRISTPGSIHGTRHKSPVIGVSERNVSIDNIAWIAGGLKIEPWSLLRN